ncbi:hypothetical protein [Lentzea sp. NPDC059081]|uniref:hypothetical protein n=1 Tax=Lentzea sp. NPDC059081 TaxID=3346719 RepID=UPI0036A13A7C
MTNNEIAATGSRTRALLWTGLVLSILTNATVQAMGLTVVGIAFGVLALLFGGGIVVHHRRG